MYHSARAITLALMILAGAVLWATTSAPAQSLTVPFRETFDHPLEPAWKVDVSQGNTIAVTDGVLRITAAGNTYAHIERPLGVDLVRVECALKPDGTYTWAHSLCLYWNRRNYCQIAVVTGESDYHVSEYIDMRCQEYYHVPCAGPAKWHRLAIELGENCIRYQAKRDDGPWTDVRTTLRPMKNMEKSPALLIIGKGYGAKPGQDPTAGATLNNDVEDPKLRGATVVSLVRDVSVERTPAKRLHLTETEVKRLRGQGCDEPGERELAAAVDPSFASVSRHYPAMKYPREVIGVMEGPQEIAILPDGTLSFPVAGADNNVGVNGWFTVGNPPVSFGQGNCAKRLLEGYMPIIVSDWRHDGLKFEQTASGWSPSMSPDTRFAGLVRLTIFNGGSKARKVPLRFVYGDNQLVSAWAVVVPARKQESIYLKIPFDKPTDAKQINAAEYGQCLAAVTGFWKVMLSKGIKIGVPEQRVSDAYRALLAYNFINIDKRNDAAGPYYLVPEGGGFYEALFGYHASRHCYAFDMLGYHQEAQRYLDSILTHLQPDGFLAAGYGLPSQGAQLWAMSKHFEITGDAKWFRKVTPKMLKMCDWIITTRNANLSRQTKGDVCYGLIKHSTYADEAKPDYCYHTDTYLLLGLEETVLALRTAGMRDEATRLAGEAAAYRHDLLQSMDRAVIQRLGRDIVPMFPESWTTLERVGYTAADYYSIVAGMVLETDILPPNDRRARLIAEFLRQQGGLCLGLCAVFGGADHAYTYGYWMNCLQRDDVKPAILGLYASLAYGMSRDTYAGVECTGLRTGDNAQTLPDSYSGTQVLLLLRNMLLRECGDTLLLGQAIPRPWLENGKEVSVQDAPTLFGNLSYSIKSRDGARKMTVHIDPPMTKAPRAIQVRLRHPTEKAIQGVTIDGVESKTFTADTVTLTGAAKPTVIEVRY